ncbi:ASCH domain-containing protein [Paenibacillus senegalimassiliensis]|uniref:ASCH domain-containing protein n=1 Tax=Paenibacillus senegalimassiliensis TaxID=1737426 RepID=UPI00073EB34D|nr:ASCH domain-containing protein [Paenibacillus senegalimassiliensis]
MDGLIIKPNWADMVLSGIKPWEIRGSRTSKRGTIGIIKSGSGQVCGTVDLVDCIPLHQPKLTLENINKHFVPINAIPYHKPWAWVFENPTIYPEPIPYRHPQGAVIWVKLNNSMI